MKYIKRIFTKATIKQNTEFGLVSIFVAAILGFYKKQDYYFVAVVILSLFSLVAPIIFYPFTIFWFGLSKILSAVSSRLLLTIIFFIVVTPVSIIRRMTGSDTMRIKQFKKSNLSAMITRNHVYLPGDLLHTF